MLLPPSAMHEGPPLPSHGLTSSRRGWTRPGQATLRRPHPGQDNTEQGRAEGVPPPEVRGPPLPSGRLLSQHASAPGGINDGGFGQPAESRVWPLRGGHPALVKCWGEPGPPSVRHFSAGTSTEGGGDWEWGAQRAAALVFNSARHCTMSFPCVVHSTNVNWRPTGHWVMATNVVSVTPLSSHVSLPLVTWANVLVPT